MPGLSKCIGYMVRVPQNNHIRYLHTVPLPEPLLVTAKSAAPADSMTLVLACVKIIDAVSL